MQYIPRMQEKAISRVLARGKSVLLLGARQTGKTTLAARWDHDLSLSFVQPDVRQRYERDPSILAGEIKALRQMPQGRIPLILLDEIQKVPFILDVVQDLIDRKIAQFLLTGSSARKLRRGPSVNLLPGRVVTLQLDPLTFREMSGMPLQDLLLYGSLPGIVSVKESFGRDADLRSYVTTYLEEEIRAEAIVRNVGSFARFLEYAAGESGNVVNCRKLSQEIGVSHTTIKSHYEILEDCLIAERVEPVSKSTTRKKLTKSQKYLLFDLGVRRAAAREGTGLSRETMGKLFEQWVGLELLRCARMVDRGVQIRFWRDPDGPEVDWIVEDDHGYVPIEVKWTDTPNTKAIKHLQVFLQEYTTAKIGYVVCRTPRRIKLDEHIVAIPWQETCNIIL